VHDLLNWLAALPDPLLYGVILLAAFAENVFPPLPADSVVALGAFVAARGNGTALGAWAATMVGNIGGAMLMYTLGRRFGMPWLAQKMPAVFGGDASTKFAERFKRQGMLAVVVSRFLPAVRAVVPPVAGAMGLGATRAALAMGAASGAWYGIVCWLAFRAGANADVLLARIAAQQRTVGILALAVVIVAALVYWLRRRRSPTQ
jgi:membrane protein DedA with SNARE-associated domain